MNYVYIRNSVDTLYTYIPNTFVLIYLKQLVVSLRLPQRFKDPSNDL